MHACNAVRLERKPCRSEDVESFVVEDVHASASSVVSPHLFSHVMRARVVLHEAEILRTRGDTEILNVLGEIDPRVPEQQQANEDQQLRGCKRAYFQAQHVSMVAFTGLRSASPR